MSRKFKWEDRYRLGFDQMDKIHSEFVEVVDSLIQSDDPEDIKKCLVLIERHAIDHFETENQWMIESNFPAAQCHIEEHSNVLKSIREVLECFDAQLAKDLGMALMDWFPGHADYLDSALATWMVKRRFSGAPLIFRRNPISSDERDNPMHSRGVDELPQSSTV
jgi:hemerythrin